MQFKNIAFIGYLLSSSAIMSSEKNDSNCTLWVRSHAKGFQKEIDYRTARKEEFVKKQHESREKQFNEKRNLENEKIIQESLESLELKYENSEIEKTIMQLQKNMVFNFKNNEAQYPEIFQEAFSRCLYINKNNIQLIGKIESLDQGDETYIGYSKIQGPMGQHSSLIINDTAISLSKEGLLSVDWYINKEKRA